MVELIPGNVCCIAWFCYALNTVHSLAQFLFFYQWSFSIEFGIIIRRLFFFSLSLYFKFNSFICVWLNLNNYWQDMKISRVLFLKKNIAPIFLLHFFCYLVFFLFLSLSLCNLNSIHLISFDYFKLVNGSEITCLRIIFLSYFIFLSFSLSSPSVCVFPPNLFYIFYIYSTKHFVYQYQYQCIIWLNGIIL